LGKNILDCTNGLTPERRFVTLWGIMESRMKSYAGLIAQELVLLSAAVWALKNKTDRDRLKKHEMESIHKYSEFLLNLSTELGLKASKHKAAVLSFYAINNENALGMRERSRDLLETMVHELFSIQFLPVSDDMVEYHGKNSLFGQAVVAAFPEASEDISEAHECFAFERYTASVFHLGRAMELATEKLAKRMHVGRPDDDWQGFLKAISKAVEGMPYGTKAEREKRSPYAAAAGFSFQFKEAWRNPTAHPKKTYTRQEALDILSGARAFMDAVARKIFKVRIPKTP